MFSRLTNGIVRIRRFLLSLGLALAIFSLLVCAAHADSRPEIMSMKTCTEVKEYPNYFDARGWTTAFHLGQTVYCVIKVGIPPDADRDSYRGTLRWYKPNGDLYHEWKAKDLKRGYIWSLWASINLSTIRASNLTGQWRVVFSLSPGPSKAVPFSVSPAPTEDTSDLLSLDVPPPTPKLPDLGLGSALNLPELGLPPTSPTQPDITKGTATIHASIALAQQATEGVVVCFKEGASLTAVLRGEVADSYVIPTEAREGGHTAIFDIAVGTWQVLAMKPTGKDNEYWISETKAFTFFKGFTYTVELALTTKTTLK